MRTGRLFWGSLFVIIGLVLLLERLNILSLDWDFGWNLWPVVLILLGIAFLVRNKPVRWVLAVLGALVLASLFLSIFSFTWVPGWRGADRAPVSQKFAEPYDPAIRRATLSLDAGAGSFVLGDTTAELLAAATRSSFAEFTLAVERGSDSAEARFTMKEHKVRFHGPHGGNRAEIRLNAAPRWDFDIDVGAASVDVDLSPFMVEKLKLDVGASRIDLKLGSRAATTDVDVDAGVSSIRISVPESSGCEVRLDAPLSSKRLPGFQSANKGVYRTENFDSSDRKIFVRVDAGVSSIRVSRY